MKKAKLTKEEYEDGGFVRVDSSIPILTWMSEFAIKHKEDFLKGKTLQSSCLDKMRKHFGRANFRYPGEYLTSNWAIDYCGAMFVVITAKGRGTTFESQGEVSLDICKNFLTDFYALQ